MKHKRSPDSARLRRDLAQLLRRLRAMKKERLSPDELASRVNLALREARSLSHLVTFSDGASRRPAGTWYTDAHLDGEAAQPRPESNTEVKRGDLAADCA